MKILFLVALFLVACSSSRNFAPVVSARYSTVKHKSHYHLVRKGETLYAIAWLHDLDYRSVARLNHLQSPYTLSVGQKLKIFPQRWSSHKSKKQKKHLASVKFHSVQHFQWPVRGKIIKRFSLANNSKGIDIAAHRGKPIRAAAAGQVAYAGSGLRAYGLLLILKHNDEYLSAYAYNRRLLVKEGQWIKVGQKIAEMGSNGSKHVMLHFEIRKKGQPVDPLRYLKKAR